MRYSLRTSLLLFLLSGFCEAEPVVYQGTSGPGQGQTIVFLAGDHEYRSEETLPALARILAKHHGFTCKVLFTLDQETGEILPGSNHMPGTDILKDADLMVIFLRFQNFPAEQMQPIVDYLERAGPVVGLRTSTHAFKIPRRSPFARFDYRYQDGGYAGGFGRQVLGETWAGHYGKNHVMSTRLDVVPKFSDHPVMRSVTKPWVQAGGYWTDPMPDSQVLALAQPLQGMQPDSPKAKEKMPCPGAWIRQYQGKGGRRGRVFTTTYGASEDILNDDFRRMLVNACFWSIGLEDQIRPDSNIDFVGPYHPTTFRFGGYRRNVRPGDLAGWDSPILPDNKPAAPRK